MRPPPFEEPPQPLSKRAAARFGQEGHVEAAGNDLNAVFDYLPLVLFVVLPLFCEKAPKENE